MMLKTKLTFCLLVMLIKGCASPNVNNHQFEQSITGRHWFEGIVHDRKTPLTFVKPSQSYLPNYSSVTSQLNKNTELSKLTSAPVLSPGDRLKAWMPKTPLFSGVFNEGNDEFSTTLEVNIDGRIKLPYLPPIKASGLTLTELERVINQRLVEQGIFNQGMAYLNLAIVEWAPVTVFVSGAVFNPGQVTINVRSNEARLLLRENNSGDFPIERLLPAALKSAGGVTPDADIRQIEVIRNGQVYSIDLAGVVLGHPTISLPLISGDMIRVNSIGTPQIELIKPSAITPPGARIFISNLTRPAFDNASSAVGQHSTSLPYGSTLLNAVVSGNCAGGTVSTNSNRLVVLVSSDPLTRKPIAIERRIEDLLRAPNRLDLNPFIMPNDSIVCYDSRVTNIRDIGKTVSDILFPVSWITRGLFTW